MIRNALANVRARVLPTIWQHRWAVVWNAGADLRSDAEWLAYHLPRFGVSVVSVKVLDGAHRFNGSHELNLAGAWLAPLRKAGLKLTGWGYCYGFDPRAEATLAAELVRELGLRAFVVDAEKEFEFDPLDSPTSGAGRERYARSREWIAAWHATRSRAQLGVTSYGRVDLHRVDWPAWARAGARFLPQAYANESAELVVPLCVERASTYFDRRFVHPWLGMYHGAAGRVSGDEYAVQLRAARTRGFAVYLADTATLDDLRGVSRSR